MSREIRVLDRGETQPRTVVVTRYIAVRMFCDCHRHLTGTRRDSWVYLIALDRDAVAAYVKHSQDPESAPWSSAAMDNAHEIKVCGMKLARADEAGGERAMVDVSSADDPDADRVVPWWDQSDEVNDPGRKREADIRRQLAEWQAKKREGWATEDDKPKMSPYMQRKLEREAAERAQHGLDLPDPNEDRVRDIDDRE